MVLNIDGAQSALSRQAKVFAGALGANHENEETLLGQTLTRKGSAITAIMTEAASGFIANYDYDTLATGDMSTPSSQLK